MSCCFNCGAKSGARCYNNATQTFAAGGSVTLDVGTSVYSAGGAVTPTNTGYVVSKSGAYHVAADVMIAPANTGALTIQAYLDGVSLPCTLTTLDATDVADVTAHLETDVKIGTGCCPQVHTVSFIVTGGTGVAGSVNHVCSAVMAI